MGFLAPKPFNWATTKCAPRWPSDMIFSPRILLFEQMQLASAFSGALPSFHCLPHQQCRRIDGYFLRYFLFLLIQTQQHCALSYNQRLEIHVTYQFLPSTVTFQHGTLPERDRYHPYHLPNESYGFQALIGFLPAKETSGLCGSQGSQIISRMSFEFSDSEPCPSHKFTRAK